MVRQSIHDNANSSGLSTEPWCIPTLTSNHAVFYFRFALLFQLPNTFPSQLSLPVLSLISSSAPTRLLPLAQNQMLFPNRSMIVVHTRILILMFDVNPSSSQWFLRSSCNIMPSLTNNLLFCFLSHHNKSILIMNLRFRIDIQRSVWILDVISLKLWGRDRIL